MSVGVLKVRVGGVWQAIVSTMGPHHISHETGGSDPLAALSAAILTSGILPDARLSGNVAFLASPAFTGTPTAPTPTVGDNSTRLATTAFVVASAGLPGPHHATHETGGSDALTALSAAILTSGTLPDARLSANVALQNVANTFSATNVFSKNFAIGSHALSLQSALPLMSFIETSAPADSKLWYFYVSGQHLYVQPTNDAETVAPGSIIIDRTCNMNLSGTLKANVNVIATGNVSASGTIYAGAFAGALAGDMAASRSDGTGVIYLGSGTHFLYWNATNYVLKNGPLTVEGPITERSRLVAIGYWQNVPYSAGNFFATGGPTWTVSSSNVIWNRYTIVGQTVIWMLKVTGTSLSGAAGFVYLVSPTGGIRQGFQRVTVCVANGASLNDMFVWFDAGSGDFVLSSPTSVTLPAGSLDLSFTLTYEVTL